MFNQKEYMKEYRQKKSEELKQYYYDNKEKQKERNKIFLEKNPNFVKEWKEKNPNYNKEYFKKRKQDPIKGPIIKLQNSIINSVYRGIKSINGIKSQKTLDILGLKNWDEFKKHIESQFTEGMTWDNYGREVNISWSIDHTIPISSATTLDEVKKLNHYTNLKPMWHIDNIKKK